MTTPLPSFAFGSNDTFDDVRDCLPSRLLALAAKAPALLGLQAPVVSAVGLAHLAASLGRSQLLNDGFTQIPACFSLAVVSDSMLSFDWLPVLGRGWMDAASKIQNLDSGHLRTVIKNTLLNIATKGPDRGAIDPQFKALAKQLPLNLVNMMRRSTIVSKVDPDAAQRAVADSRDHCAVLMNGAGEPMTEWADSRQTAETDGNPHTRLAGQAADGHAQRSGSSWHHTRPLADARRPSAESPV